MAKSKRHIPVLLKEVLEYLDPKKGEIVVDATIGLGGHSEEFLKKVGEKGRVIGIDKDTEALEIARRRLKKYNYLDLVHGDFANIEKVVKKKGGDRVDKIIADLGISSYQIEEESRGFSFKKEGPLDMRMDKSGGVKAYDIVNEYGEKELIQIFKTYGEERFSKQVAKNIIKTREKQSIETTKELRKIIVDALPTRYVKTLKIDPATKVFQALRVEVNGELKSLGGFLPQATRILKKGGRLAVISFHSLEDRMVKDFFRTESLTCICPKDYPICKCDKEATVKVLTKKPVMASEGEIKKNPRSRSAKLRVAEKI